MFFKDKKKINREILEYQPDAVEIEEKPVSGKIRWVLYVIILFFIAVITGAVIFKVDRIVVAEGKLITTLPTIVIQPLNTAIIRSIDVQVGDIVEKDQSLATLDSTFTTADLSQLQRQRISLGAQLRRIEAELKQHVFQARSEEGEDGLLQEQLFRQRQLILKKTRQMSDDKKAALQSKKDLNNIKRQGGHRQLKVLRDVEGTNARLPQQGPEYRLRLLDSQKARYLAENEIANLEAEEEVINNELRQIESEWQQFLEERLGKLMEEKVRLRAEYEKIDKDLNKAQRLQELVVLKAPQRGIVLNLAQRSVGSILQQAEPFVTLVPVNSKIEVEVNVTSKDIARIRLGDPVRVKLEAFPFQKYGTLQGEVRVISEDAFSAQAANMANVKGMEKEGEAAAFYRNARYASDPKTPQCSRWV